MDVLDAPWPDWRGPGVHVRTLIAVKPAASAGSGAAEPFLVMT